MISGESKPLKEHDRSPSGSAILLVYLVFVAGMVNNWGYFSWRGLILVLAATVLTTWFHVRPCFPRPSTEAMLTGIVLASVVVSCFLTSGQHQEKVFYDMPGIAATKWQWTAPGIAIKVLNALAVLTGLAYVMRIRKIAAKYLLTALVAMAIAMRALMLFSTPVPKIDVFVSQTYGAWGLPRGKNVYAMAFPSPYAREPFLDKQGVLRMRSLSRNYPEYVEYVLDEYGFPHEFKKTRQYQEALHSKLVYEKALGHELDLALTFEHYGYPPATVYCNFISWHMFADVRALWLICDLMAALFMFLLAQRMNPAAKNQRFCALLTLTFLFMPRTLFVLEQSFTEPLVVVCLGGFALALAWKRGTGLLGSLLGFWVSSKQYVVVVIPLLVRLRKCRLWAWVIAAGVGIAVVLPFALWDLGALYEDLLGFFTESRGRGDALSVYGIVARFGGEIPWWIVIPVWLGAVGFFTWKMRRTLAGWLFSTAGLWLCFFMLGKQAFVNYFYVIAYTLLLGVAACPQCSEPPDAEPYTG